MQTWLLMMTQIATCAMRRKKKRYIPFVIPLRMTLLWSLPKRLLVSWSTCEERGEEEEEGEIETFDRKKKEESRRERESGMR